MKRMNGPETDTEMKTNAIDRILSSEGEMIPSSGFVAAAMERVREEAAVPAPIPFPWKRVAPGLVLVAGVIGWGTWTAAQIAWPTLGEIAQSSPQIPIAAVPSLQDTGWVALALAVSLGSWMLSRRITRG